MKTFLTLFLAILLFGCAALKDNTKSVMDSWIGSTKNKLIMSWGPPARTTSDGDNGEVLIYSQTTYNTYNRVTTYHYKMFYAHSDGVIYYWRTNSSAVPPQQVDVDLRIRNN